MFTRAAEAKESLNFQESKNSKVHMSKDRMIQTYNNSRITDEKIEEHRDGKSQKYNNSKIEESDKTADHFFIPNLKLLSNFLKLRKYENFMSPSPMTRKCNENR